MRCILAAYQKEGVSALAGGNRGWQPAHTVAQDGRLRVLSLACTNYAGANQSHLRDLFAEREDIILSRASVGRKLLEGRLISGQVRKRFAQEGMLI